MKKINLIAMLIALVWLTACNEEDPGPFQQDRQSYAVVDFDRIEAEDALIVDIKYGENFSIEANGDRRNLNDLLVIKNGGTLSLRFNHSERRQYATYVNITLPALYGVDFSGAVNAKVSGFTNISRMDLSLSGASLAQLNMNVEKIHFSLSGASQLRLSGEGQLVDGNVSGASILSAFDFNTTTSTLTVSGASHGNVTVSQRLEVSASGASEVLYRGRPQVIAEVTGSSVVRED